MDNENLNPQNEAAPKFSIPENYQKILRWVGLGLIALVLLIIVISVVSALMPDKFEDSGKNYVEITQNDDGEYMLIFNGKKPVTLDEDLSKKILSESQFQFSYDQKYCVVAVSADSDEKENEDEDDGDGDSLMDAIGGIVDDLLPSALCDLYVITSKGEECVAEDIIGYYLSPLGDTIHYLNEDGDLYSGTLSKAAKAKVVGSDVAYVNAVSPDGSAVAYTRVTGEGEDMKSESYISVNGKEGKKFDTKDSTIVALSNKGKYVYYEKEDSGFYVNDTKLAGKDDYVLGNFCFNKDGSQVIFSISDDEDVVKSYIVNKGKEKVSIEKGTFYGVLSPENTVNVSYGATNYTVAYNVSSFVKCALRIDDNFYLLKNLKGENEKLTEIKNCTSLKMLDDGKTVIFLKNNSLRSYDITKYNKSATEYDFGDDIEWFDCTSDGKNIFVIDENDTLSYVKSKTKLKKIADDTIDVQVVDGGKVYYITEDDELYLGGKSGSPKKVEDDIEGINYYENANDFYAWSKDSFYSVNGKKAKKLFSIG